MLVIPPPISSGNLTIVIAPLTALPGLTPAQFVVRPLPNRECGTYKTAKAGFRPWLSGKSP